MIPLINKFSNNLSKPCPGCNGSGAIYETWRKAKETGENMKFQFMVVIEADTYKEAVSKVPDEMEILSGGVKPEPRPSGIQTSGQFARTQTQQVNG